MDKDYTPPPMFGEEEKSEVKEAPSPKPQYFKPPLPPKRPKSFQLSKEMIEHLRNRNRPIQSLKRPSIGTDINNDTGNDIRIMNANDVFNSINR